MRLGPVIRRWRKMEERDLREVAEEIGITPSTLSRLESGQTPNGETLSAVVCWLIRNDTAPSASPDETPQT